MPKEFRESDWLAEIERISRQCGGEREGFLTSSEIAQALRKRGVIVTARWVTERIIRPAMENGMVERKTVRVKSEFNPCARSTFAFRVDMKRFKKHAREVTS